MVGEGSGMDVKNMKTIFSIIVCVVLCFGVRAGTIDSAGYDTNTFVVSKTAGTVTLNTNSANPRAVATKGDLVYAMSLSNQVYLSKFAATTNAFVPIQTTDDNYTTVVSTNGELDIQAGRNDVSGTEATMVLSDGYRYTPIQTSFFRLGLDADTTVFGIDSMGANFNTAMELSGYLGAVFYLNSQDPQNGVTDEHSQPSIIAIDGTKGKNGNPGNNWGRSLTLVPENSVHTNVGGSIFLGVGKGGSGQPDGNVVVTNALLRGNTNSLQVSVLGTTIHGPLNASNDFILGPNGGQLAYNNNHICVGINNNISGFLVGDGTGTYTIDHSYFFSGVGIGGTFLNLGAGLAIGTNNVPSHGKLDVWGNGWFNGTVTSMGGFVGGGSGLTGLDATKISGLPNDATKFLNGLGVFSVPSGSGGTPGYTKSLQYVAGTFNSGTTFFLMPDVGSAGNVPTALSQQIGGSVGPFDTLCTNVCVDIAGSLGALVPSNNIVLRVYTNGAVAGTWQFNGDGATAHTNYAGTSFTLPANGTWVWSISNGVGSAFSSSEFRMGFRAILQ